MARKYDMIAGTERIKCKDSKTGEILNPKEGFILKGTIYDSELDSEGNPITTIIESGVYSKETLIKLLGGSDTVKPLESTTGIGGYTGISPTGILGVSGPYPKY